MLTVIRLWRSGAATRRWFAACTAAAGGVRLASAYSSPSRASSSATAKPTTPSPTLRCKEEFRGMVAAMSDGTNRNPRAFARTWDPPKLYRHHSRMNASIDRANSPEPLDWSLVQLFLALCESGSMGRASTGLGISQPTLSRRLVDLEAALGQARFERTARGLVLTPAGLIVRRMADMPVGLYAHKDSIDRCRAPTRATADMARGAPRVARNAAPARRVRRAGSGAGNTLSHWLPGPRRRAAQESGQTITTRAMPPPDRPKR